MRYIKLTSEIRGKICYYRIFIEVKGKKNANDTKYDCNLI